MIFISKRAYRRILWAALMAVLTTVIAPWTASAQTAVPASAVPLVVGVLDWDFVLHESKAAQGIIAWGDKQAQTYNAQFAQQENALRAEAQQLEQQRATLSPQDYDTKRKALGQKVETWRQSASAKNKQLQQAGETALNKVKQALVEATAEIAKAHGMSLVLNKAAVVVNATNFDITQEALQKLNSRLPSVALPAQQ